MGRIRQRLVMGSFMLVIAVSAARSADCTTNPYVVAYFKADDELDRETKRYASMAHPSRYDSGVCSAARKTFKALKEALAKANCLNEKSTKLFEDQMPRLGKQEGLACAPGK